MKKHSNTYEQYCCVLNKNVIMEEIIYHNGGKALRCTNAAACSATGGCRNRIIKKAIVDVEKNDVCLNVPV